MSAGTCVVEPASSGEGADEGQDVEDGAWLGLLQRRAMREWDARNEKKRLEKSTSKQQKRDLPEPLAFRCHSNKTTRTTTRALAGSSSIHCSKASTCASTRDAASRARALTSRPSTGASSANSRRTSADNASTSGSSGSGGDTITLSPLA